MTTITKEEYDRGGHQHGAETWDEYDARGLYLCRVCEACVGVALAGFRPDVLTDASYWHDEPLDEDQW